jgi:hypothetical protein
MRLHRLTLIVPLLVVLSLFAACSSQPDATPIVTRAPSDTSADPATATPPEAADSEYTWEDFDPNNFNNPTEITNQWLPLTPGMQYIFEGDTEESGIVTAHQVIFTITDLTKIIDGVRSVVIWDRDYSEGVLVETELAFFAQDNDGNVWRMGEYPEVYENGVLVEAPAWLSGFKGAIAGIMMPFDPTLGAPSYSQGWGPAVDFTDRAQVDQIDQQVCIPLDCYEEVMVVAEFSRSEPNAFQLKYYAPGVGNIKIGYSGDDATRENLELVEIRVLSSEELAEVRESALQLEENAYEISKEVYDQTEPAE